MTQRTSSSRPRTEARLLAAPRATGASPAYLATWERRLPPSLFGGAGAIPTLALLLLAILTACSVFREAPATPRPTQVVQITADQAAQAMEADEFYSTYGHTALLISGTVAAVDPQPSHFIVTLATGIRTKVLCDLGSQAPAIKAGDAVRVRSANPENDVARQDAAVLIRNCTLVP